MYASKGICSVSFWKMSAITSEELSCCEISFQFTLTSVFSECSQRNPSKEKTKGAILSNSMLLALGRWISSAGHCLLSLYKCIFYWGPLAISSCYRWKKMKSKSSQVPPRFIACISWTEIFIMLFVTFSILAAKLPYKKLCISLHHVYLIFWSQRLCILTIYVIANGTG